MELSSSRRRNYYILQLTIFVHYLMGNPSFTPSKSFSLEAFKYLTIRKEYFTNSALTIYSRQLNSTVSFISKYNSNYLHIKLLSILSFKNSGKFLLNYHCEDSLSSTARGRSRRLTLIMGKRNLHLLHRCK